MAPASVSTVRSISGLVVPRMIAAPRKYRNGAAQPRNQKRDQTPVITSKRYRPTAATATDDCADPRRRDAAATASAAPPKHQLTAAKFVISRKIAEGSGQVAPGGAKAHRLAHMPSPRITGISTLAPVMSSSDRVISRLRGTERARTRSTRPDSTSPAGSDAT